MKNVRGAGIYADALEEGGARRCKEVQGGGEEGGHPSAVTGGVGGSSENTTKKDFKSNVPDMEVIG